jgi:hypothetical protein
MVVSTREDTTAAYVAYDSDLGSDYIESVSTATLVVGSSATDSLEKTIYF